MSDISKFDQTIDSREIIARLEELQEEKQDLVDAVEERQEALNDARQELQYAEQDIESKDNDEEEQEEANLRHSGAVDKEQDAESELEDAQRELADWIADNQEELDTLQDVNDQGEDYGDWSHGETLIHENHFTDYCEELVSDIGDMPRKIPGYIVIDWEATAENLRADYTSIDFDGETFYMLS